MTRYPYNVGLGIAGSEYEARNSRRPPDRSTGLPAGDLYARGRYNSAHRARPSSQSLVRQISNCRGSPPSVRGTEYDSDIS
jgi:hypothetical protein